MATKPFKYQEMFPMGKDSTEYYLLTKDYVSVENFDGKEVLKVEPEALTRLANTAMRDVSFLLRREHNEMVARILHDPEASDNDKYVALTMLRNAEVACKGQLPFCQDTGTAIVMGKKGQQVWTGGGDEEALSLGVYKTYTEENLRYSQNAPLDMYREVNTGCNLPAQIDLYAVDGMEYKFLFIAKGGGSANKTYLYQETKALITPDKLVNFLVEKMKTLGTAACPPYHIAFVIGGTSAEMNLKTVKLASAKYYDNLPTSGNELGHAFRDIELEKEVLRAAQESGIGAQFGGKYFAHDVRIIRLPRHGASCPVGLGVSCSADRNIKAKINREGLWIERLDDNYPRRVASSRRRECRKDRFESPDERNPCRIDQISCCHAIVAQRNHYSGSGYCPCQNKRTSRCRRGDAAVSQRSPYLLCRTGQDAQRNGIGLVWAYDGGAYGFVCRPVPKQRRLYGHDRQRQS